MIYSYIRNKILAKQHVQLGALLNFFLNVLAIDIDSEQYYLTMEIEGEEYYIEMT